MPNHSTLLAGLLWTATLFPLAAQDTGTALTFHDLAAWKRISEKTISAHGHRVAATLEPWIGNPSVELYDRRENRIARFEPARNPHFTASGRFLVVTETPLYRNDRFVKAEKTPVLIMANDRDGHVPWYQGIEYFVALKRLGKPVWLLNYTGEPHWPLRMANRIDFQKRMYQFFQHYLNGEPMPRWMKEGIPAARPATDTGYE